MKIPLTTLLTLLTPLVLNAATFIGYNKSQDTPSMQAKRIILDVTIDPRNANVLKVSASKTRF